MNDVWSLFVEYPVVLPGVNLFENNSLIHPSKVEKMSHPLSNGFSAFREMGRVREVPNPGYMYLR